MFPRYGRIDIDKIWKLARRISILAADDPKDVAADLPERCPLKLDELLAEDLDGAVLAVHIRRAAGDQAG